MSGVRDEILQQVWRHTHAAAARQALSTAQLDELRKFVSGRLRHMPHTIVDLIGDADMRPSFLDALDHAARAIADGTDFD